MDATRISGCLFGMAFGDALGADTEFLTYEGILKKYPPNGPIEPPGKPARVTDDTQMALAVGEALIAAPKPYAPDTLGEQLRKAMIAWYDDPDNNRAPGNTCLSSCERLIAGETWVHATDISSKGCGANMRVQAVGLLDVDATTRAAIAQYQAAYTHGHPTALAAADLTAFVIADLAHGGDPVTLPQRTREYAQSQREIYHADWLGDLWKRATMMDDEKGFIAHGWNECLGVLDKLDDAMLRLDRTGDPCLATGAGWVADQAFGTALLCFLLFPDDPVAVVRHAAVTSGDSDSIACIAGAFAGAHRGLDAWPHDWLERIEYHDRIATLARRLNA